VKQVYSVEEVGRQAELWFVCAVVEVVSWVASQKLVDHRSTYDCRSLLWGQAGRCRGRVCFWQQSHRGQPLPLAAAR